MYSVKILGLTEVVKIIPEGSVLSPREFLHLGSRAAVDQVFSRLIKQGELLRIARGLYAAPVVNRFGKRPLWGWEGALL